MSATTQTLEKSKLLGQKRRRTVLFVFILCLSIMAVADFTLIYESQEIVGVVEQRFLRGGKITPAALAFVIKLENGQSAHVLVPFTTPFRQGAPVIIRVEESSIFGRKQYRFIKYEEKEGE